MRILLGCILIPFRDKRVEKLEKRLEWIEDQLRQTIESRPKAESESRLHYRGQEAPNANYSPVENSSITHNFQGNNLLNTNYAILETSPQSLDLGIPSSKSDFHF
jgi:hypothetical protein